VLRRLVECLGRDRTKHQVAEVTSLGLVQMTRKRIGTGLLEAFSETCEHCGGRGLILHDEPREPRRRQAEGRAGDDGGRGRGRDGGRDGGRESGKGTTKSSRGGRGRGRGKQAEVPEEEAAEDTRVSDAPVAPEAVERTAVDDAAGRGTADADLVVTPV